MSYATYPASSGNTNGPASSVDNGIAQFDGTSGKLLKDLGVGTANQVLKTDGTAPSFGLIANANVDASAAIAYSKLALSDSIVNADINSSAAIAYSKLNLTTSIVNGDINASAAIDFSKLATLGSGQMLVGSSGGVPTARVIGGDISISDLGQVQITGGVIIDNDINASAGISFSKLAALTDSYLLVGSATNVPTAVAVTGDVTISNTGVTAISSGVIVNADINALAAIEFSKLESLTSGNILVGSAGNVPTSVAVTGDVTISNTGVTAISSGVIVNDDVNALAGIALTKLAVVAANRALATDASGFIVASTVTDTELGYLSGVTSAIQTQLNGKVSDTGDTMTGALTINTASNQLVLSSGVNQLTLNSGTSAAARTYTIPDVGTTANFVMTAGAQTIAGAKTFSDDLTVGSTALFVDVSTGNVGIGTSNPISPFHVVGAPGVATRVLTLNNSTTSATDSLVAFVIEGTNRGFAGADTSNCFKVIGSAGGSAVRMTITDAGAVTLGPSGTTEHLVNGALKIKTTGSTAALVFAHRNDEVNNWQVGKDDSGLGGTDGFYFFSYGIPNYVGGISTAGAWTLGPSGGSVTHKAYGTFEVYNTSPSQGFIFNPNSTSGFFLGGGVIASGAGTHFLKWNSGTGIVTYDTSSILVKEKIQDSPYGLASVMQLQPRKYYRTDDQKDEIGFIADEVKEIVPELVSWMEKKNITRNEDDTELVPATLDYGKMTSVLVKAIQELKAELDALKGT